MALAHCLVLPVLLLLACGAREPRAFTYVPSKTDFSAFVPWRVVLLPDGRVDSQAYYRGVRRSKVVPARIDERRIEFAQSPKLTVALVRQPDGTWLLHHESLPSDLVFRTSREWDEKFENALPVPRTKTEAMATLRKMLKPEELAEYRAMKRDDAELRRRLGNVVEIPFGIAEPDSPLRADLGGGASAEAVVRLVVSFWEDLQQR